MLPCAHPSPQPKRHLDRFSRFYTAHSTVSLYFTMGRPFPSKSPLTMGISGPHLTYGSLCTRRSKRHLDRFSWFCRAHDRDRQIDRQTCKVWKGVSTGPAVRVEIPLSCSPLFAISLKVSPTTVPGALGRSMQWTVRMYRPSRDVHHNYVIIRGNNAQK